MRFLFSLALLFCFFSFTLSAPFSFSAVPDYSDYTFERFVAEFSKKYSSPESKERHRVIFQRNLNKIQQHNRDLADKNHSYYMKVNRWADLDETTIVSKFTGRSRYARKINKMLKNNNVNKFQSSVSSADLPVSVDWRNQGAVSPVKDQGSCGSCWAHSAVESIESHLYLATKKMTVLSPQHMLECTPNPNHCGGKGGCEGATCELGFEWAKSGIAAVETVPYLGADDKCPANVTLAAKVGGYVKLPENNGTALLEAVATVGPISVSVDASAWSFYGGGIFNGCNKQNPTINHAVQLVGYGSENGNDYWLVRNSWSSGWGESGYIRLYRGKAESCGTDTAPGDGSACDGQTDPVKVCGTCGDRKSVV